MKTSTKRNDILICASRLFNQYGFKAVGIDRIIEESKTAKMTMYNHFSSKDDIILEVLDGFNTTLLSEVLNPIESKNWTSKRKIKSLIDIYEKWFLSENFYGCPFHKAIAEFPEKNHPVHQKIKDHYDLLMNFLTKTIKSKTLASQILLVLEGSIIKAKISSDYTSSKEAWKIISKLI